MAEAICELLMAIGNGAQDDGNITDSSPKNGVEIVTEIAPNTTLGPDVSSTLWPDGYDDELMMSFFLLYRFVILIPSLLFVLIVMLMEVRKSCCKQCLRGHFAMIIPVNFLENKRDRLTTLSAFAITSLDVLTILLQKDIIGPGANVFEKVFIRICLVLLTCLVCLPLLLCYTANTYVSLILGIIYLIIYLFVVWLDQMTGTFLKEIESKDDEPQWGDLAKTYSAYFIITVSALVMFVGYCRKIYLKCKGKDKESADFYKYQKQYLKRLLKSKILSIENPQNSLLEEECLENEKELQKGKCVSCWHKHVYESIPGFRYSLSLLISITVGIVAISHLYAVYLAMFSQLYVTLDTIIILGFQGWKKISLPNILEKLANVVFKNVKFSDDFQLTLFDFVRQQVSAIMGSFIAASVFSYFSVCFISLHMVKSYRGNVLSLVQRKNEDNLLKIQSTSNVSLVVSAIQYAGYQVAYIVWGAHLQLFTIFLVLVALCELLILPLMYAFTPVIIAIGDKIIPIVLVMVLTKGVQIILVKFVFLQERGAVLALDNRKGFFTMMYFMFFYNIFMGIFSCLMRIIKSLVFGLLFLPRLDRSIFPRTFERFDGGFKSYSSLLKLEAVQSNVIVTTFANALLRNDADEQAVDEILIQNMNGQITDTKAAEPLLKKQSSRARNRWLVAYTLMKNPDLKSTRSPKPITGEKLTECESTV